MRFRDVASPGPTQGNIRMRVYTGGHLKTAAPEHLPAPTLFVHSFYCWLLAWTAAVSLHLPTSALQSPALSPAQSWAFRRSLVKHGCITDCVHSVSCTTSSLGHMRQVCPTPVLDLMRACAGFQSPFRKLPQLQIGGRQGRHFHSRHPGLSRLPLPQTTSQSSSSTLCAAPD